MDGERLGPAVVDVLQGGDQVDVKEGRPRSSPMVASRQKKKSRARVSTKGFAK
jgi:hypothetical protein